MLDQLGHEYLGCRSSARDSQGGHTIQEQCVQLVGTLDQNGLPATGITGDFATSRRELEEFDPPTTTTASQRGAIAATALCRFVVA